jgi:AcrR family transcriptional regulator
MTRRRAQPAGPAAEAAGSSDARIEAKRRQFYAVAEPLFERFGYRKTTVEDVCKAAGASKRTFYELFVDKADLASRLVLDAGLAIVANWRARVTPRMSAVDKFDRFIDEYVRLGKEHRIFGLMMTDPDLLRAFGHLTQERQFELLIDVLKSILVEGMESGEFRRLEPDAVTWIIYSLLDTMYYLLPTMEARPGPLEDPKLAGEIRAFLIHGLLNGSPRVAAPSGRRSGRAFPGLKPRGRPSSRERQRTPPTSRRRSR